MLLFVSLTPRYPVMFAEVPTQDEPGEEELEELEEPEELEELCMVARANACNES